MCFIQFFGRKISKIILPMDDHYYVWAVSNAGAFKYKNKCT